MWPWRVKMPTQNLLRLLLLLMLMMRIVLTKVCCRFLSWGLVIKQIFCSDFGNKVWSRLWSWSSAKIYKLESVQYFATDVFLEVWSWILVNILICKFNRGADVRLRFWSWCMSRFWRRNLIKICVWACLNFGKLNSTLGSVVPLAIFELIGYPFNTLIQDMWLK